MQPGSWLIVYYLTLGGTAFDYVDAEKCIADAKVGAGVIEIVLEGGGAIAEPFYYAECRGYQMRPEQADVAEKYYPQRK